EDHVAARYVLPQELRDQVTRVHAEAVVLVQRATHDPAGARPHGVSRTAILRAAAAARAGGDVDGCSGGSRMAAMPWVASMQDRYPPTRGGKSSCHKHRE